MMPNVSDLLTRPVESYLDPVTTGVLIAGLLLLSVLALVCSVLDACHRWKLRRMVAKEFREFDTK